jgi:hypothetical protein
MPNDVDDAVRQVDGGCQLERSGALESAGRSPSRARVGGSGLKGHRKSGRSPRPLIVGQLDISQDRQLRWTFAVDAVKTVNTVVPGAQSAGELGYHSAGAITQARSDGAAHALRQVAPALACLIPSSCSGRSSVVGGSNEWAIWAPLRSSSVVLIPPCRAFGRSGQEIASSRF